MPSSTSAPSTHGVAPPAAPSARAKGPVTVLYGIPNCDQVRKARAWLKARGIEYRFHNFKTDGLTPALLSDWFRHLPWDSLLNRRGTTWRQLPDQDRARVVDQASASELMLAHPAIIKRPVLSHEGHLLVGFSDPVYTTTFAPQ